MQTTLALEDIKVSVADLVRSLHPGDEVVLTQGAQPVAKLVSEGPREPKQPRPAPGLCRGMITHMAKDFDAPLDCMREYME